MIDIALTGNRFSGKDTVSKLLEKHNFPVFHADVILKFLFNTNSKVRNQIDSIESINDNKFDELLDLIEFALFKSYNDFKEANKNSSCVFFHTSLLFEREWQHNFNYVVNVYCPQEQRLERMKNKFKFEDTNSIKKILNSEISEFVKCQKSDFVFNNSEESSSVVQLEKLKNFLSNLNGQK